MKILITENEVGRLIKMDNGKLVLITSIKQMSPRKRYTYFSKVTGYDACTLEKYIDGEVVSDNDEYAKFNQEYEYNKQKDKIEIEELRALFDLRNPVGI